MLDSADRYFLSEAKGQLLIWHLLNFVFQIATLLTHGELRLASNLVSGLIQPVKLLSILCLNGYLFQNLYCQCQRQSKSIEAVATNEEIQEMGSI